MITALILSPALYKLSEQVQSSVVGVPTKSRLPILEPQGKHFPGIGTLVISSSRAFLVYHESTRMQEAPTPDSTMMDCIVSLFEDTTETARQLMRTIRVMVLVEHEENLGYKTGLR